MNDELLIHYSDGNSGTFYKRFQQSINNTVYHGVLYPFVRETLVGSLLAEVLPWKNFDMWLDEDVAIYICGFGKITKDTRVAELLDKGLCSNWAVMVVPADDEEMIDKKFSDNGCNV